MNGYEAVVNVLLAKERIDTVKRRYLGLQNFCLDLFLTLDIETLGDRPCINYGGLRWMTILFVCDSRVDIVALSTNYSDKKVDLRSTLDAFLFSEDSDAFPVMGNLVLAKGGTAKSIFSTPFTLVTTVSNAIINIASVPQR